MRIVFTGGSGKAGRDVIPYLLAQGHQVLNVDRVVLDHPGVNTLLADLTQGGEAMNALSCHFNYDGYATSGGPARPDAVVHFAAVPRILMRPDNATFLENVASTYNVIEAAMKLGIRKVIIASSETTYGVCFAEGDRDYKEFPLTEDYDVDPMDSYGLSKVLNEVTARSFARRSGADIYALRIGNVVEPHEYAELFPGYFANPDMRRRNAFCYIDARDLGQIVDRCLETDGLGFQVFNAGNDTNGMNIPTAELIARFFPGVPVTRPLGENEALFSNRKIREVLGFREEHDWRQYVSG